jgi:glucokinase
MTLILAGDVGGTKCKLALFRAESGILQAACERRFSAKEHAHFEQLLDAFLREAREADSSLKDEPVVAASFAAAGLIVDQRVQVTNAPWKLDGPVLARHLGLSHVHLINDLAAWAHGLDHLPSSDFLPLTSQEPQSAGPQALLAAGTGLGEAIRIWDGRRYVVVPSEGGQTDFAPRTEREIELLRFLMSGGKQTNWEAIVSGRGFRVLHEFLGPAVQHSCFDRPDADSAPEIAENGLARSCPVCVDVLDMWTQLYAAEACNLALRVLAVGGVFLAGGIVLKLLPKFQEGIFLRSFRQNARLADLLARIPVFVVLNESAPLWGAAYQALSELNP